MARDNERILEICAELSAKLKSGAIEMMNAGAPTDIVIELLGSTRLMDNIAEHLCAGRASRVEHYTDPYPTPMVEALSHALNPVSERLDKLIASLEPPQVVISKDRSDA